MKINLEFESYKELIAFCEQLVGPAEIKKPRKTNKAPKKTETPAQTPEAAPKPTPQPEVPAEPTPEPEATAPTAPTVTREELMKYIQENCADNVQPLMDMLARMGYQRVSMIPDEKLGEALTTLKGE